MTGCRYSFEPKMITVWAVELFIAVNIRESDACQLSSIFDKVEIIHSRSRSRESSWGNKFAQHYTC